MVSTTPKQLPLPVSLDDQAVLDNFYFGDALMPRLLAQFITENTPDYLMLVGQQGLGKSHLLQAMMHQAEQQQRRAFYLPLAFSADFQAEWLLDLVDNDLVILDDVDAVLGDDQWERALFNLYNELMAKNKQLLLSAKQPPAQLAISLPDLKSRLSHGMIIQLPRLDEAQKLAALNKRAKFLGLNLHPDAAKYLFNHFSRDLSALIQSLKQLDQASLEKQRAITLPLVMKSLA